MVAVNQLANALSRFMRNQPADSIPALIALNQKLQGENRNFLTAIHPLILYAALQSGQLGQAIALLRESPVFDVDVRVSMRATYSSLKLTCSIHCRNVPSFTKII